MTQVLVAVDDADVRSTLRDDLTGLGYAVCAVGTVWSALREIADYKPDLIVLDLGLPELDFRETMKLIRAMSNAPIVAIATREAEREIVAILRDGADDYLIQPFRVGELSARIEAVLHRTTSGPSAVIRAGELEIDLLRHAARLGGAALDLTPREFDLLAYLASRPGEVIARADLLSEIWRKSHGDERTVDAHLARLRRKLGETVAEPRYLHTVRTIGVRFDIPIR